MLLLPAAKPARRGQSKAVGFVAVKVRRGEVLLRSAVVAAHLFGLLSKVLVLCALWFGLHV